MGKKCADVKRWRAQHYVAEDSAEEDDDQEDNLLSFGLYSKETMNNDSVIKDTVKPFVIDVCINGHVLKFQVDTGSPATIVSEDKLVHFGKQVED